MRKISTRLAVSILIVSILVLAGGTAFGIKNQTNDTNSTGNVTVTQTPEVTVTQTPEVTVTQTPEVTVTQTPEETVTQTPEVTVTQTPVPKTPGFEAIFAIATLSVVYIFGIRRR